VLNDPSPVPGSAKACAATHPILCAHVGQDPAPGRTGSSPARRARARGRQQRPQTRTWRPAGERAEIAGGKQTSHAPPAQSRKIVMGCNNLGIQIRSQLTALCYLHWLTTPTFPVPLSAAPMAAEWDPAGRRLVRHAWVCHHRSCPRTAPC
jgi:hypothetical protein